MPDNLFDTRSAESQLASLLARVEAGEDITLVRDGQPIARLVGVAQGRRTRIVGLLKGQFELPDDFNDEDEEINQMFYEGDIFPPKR